MQVLLLHLDGRMPNLALMRIAAHHRDRGDQVELRHAGNGGALEPRLGDPEWGRVYGSLIFERTKPLATRAAEVYPGIALGGTGWNLYDRLNDINIDDDGPVDYSVYPKTRYSIGFTQRGCRLKCKFCVVPRKEGKMRPVRTIAEIWRGDPWPRDVVLLDNDFFGQPEWSQRIDELVEGGFRVNFNQGINARFLDDKTAAAVASVDYRNERFTTKRLYTAWDGRKDENRLFRGLEALVRHGVKPDEIMVYMLVGYEAGETHADRDYRRAKLREFGCRPYPMPFVRTPEIVGFARWVIGAFDKEISYREFEEAHWEPRKLKRRQTQQVRLPVIG